MIVSAPVQKYFFYHMHYFHLKMLPYWATESNSEAEKDRTHTAINLLLKGKKTIKTYQHQGNSLHPIEKNSLSRT